MKPLAISGNRTLLLIILLIAISTNEAMGHKVFTPKNGLKGETAMVVEGNSDTVWVYTFYQIPAGSGFEVIGGVSEFKESGNWTTYDDLDGLASDLVFDIAIEGDSIWFATPHGASLFDKAKGTWTTLKAEDGLASNEVKAVGIGTDAVWFGTIDGVTAYDKTSGSMTSYSMEDGLIFSQVKEVVVDGDRVYFGTSKGVGVFDSKSGEWSSITTNDGLMDNSVSSIVIAFDSIWFATESGVSRLHKSTGQWEHYDASSGLPSASVSSAAVGGDAIWFVTMDGVARFKPDKGKWKVFTKGLPLTEINDIAYGRNQVWLATNKGLVRLGTRIPLTYVLLVVLAVAGGATASIKLKPIMARKAEEAQPKRRRPKGPPPWQRCGGTPSRKLCPVCKYNSLRGDEFFCTKHRMKIRYPKGEGEEEAQ